MKVYRSRQITAVAVLYCAALVPVTVVAAPPATIEINGDDLAAGQLYLNLGFNVKTGPLREGVTRVSVIPAAPTIPAVTFGFYPADLQNPQNNPTLQKFTSHNIFVNPLNPVSGVYAQSAGGPTLSDADTFLGKLYSSNMFHILDQYTAGLAATVGQGAALNYNVYRQTLGDADLAVLVHASARTFGAGYGQIHHLFFSQGTDVCTQFGASGSSVECYSPDNPATWYFCGFHGSMKFADLGVVIFSVEPYTNVSGCRVPTSPAGASPNGPAIDSMASVLSHETFEAITDPDQNLNAWYNRRGAFAGNEIGDECAFVFALPAVSLNGTSYQIQSEYSNTLHGCTWVP